MEGVELVAVDVSAAEEGGIWRRRGARKRRALASSAAPGVSSSVRDRWVCRRGGGCGVRAGSGDGVGLEVLAAKVVFDGPDLGFTCVLLVYHT